MLGQDVTLSKHDFQPYLPDHKRGYFELEQLRPGVVMCPHCDTLIDVKESGILKATYEVILVWPDSWASVPVCKCPGVWAVYDPNAKKWAFRYQASGYDNNMENI